MHSRRCLPLGGFAQTAQELENGANDTANVLNYGMGYSLQRYSPLTQINRQTAKNLVPVWNYSYDDNHSEESQPLIYKGVLYVTTNSATMALNARTGEQIWKTKVEYPAGSAAHRVLRHHQPRCRRCTTARCSARRSMPM